MFIFFSFKKVHASGGGFIGNGGDGIEIGGTIYLRELYELNVHLQPHFGARIDPGLAKMPSDLPFEYSKELLARKLTDINSVYSGLGDYILSAIKYYQWLPADAPFLTLFGDSKIYTVPTQLTKNKLALRMGGAFHANFGAGSIAPTASMMSQIAIRLGRTIRVNVPAYIRMNPENQVALIIHEAIYSLVKPIPAYGGVFVQPGDAAHEINARFFDADSSRAPARLLQLLSRSLDIPPPLALQDVRTHSKLQLNFSAGLIQSVNAPNLRESTDLDGLNRFERRFCRKVKRFFDLSGETIGMTSQFEPSPISLQEVDYDAGGQRQIHLAFIERSPTKMRRASYYSGYDSCLSFFSSDILAFAKGNF